jgi:hypothetical protein
MGQECALKDHGPLPAHLVEHWGNNVTDPRDSPSYCARAARRYPAIPWHNGTDTCLLCRKKGPTQEEHAAYRQELKAAMHKYWGGKCYHSKPCGGVARP